MSRLLVFSRDPGAANTVIPLVHPLRERGCDVLLYGKDAALDKYRQAGLDGTDVLMVMPEVTLDSVMRFIEKESPETIITGTSADDFTEKFLWKAGSVLGIPTLAILDQWCNYGLRFSSYGVNDIKKYAGDGSHPYLPTLIVAMDDVAREEMLADGLPEERIKVCGQPYFESILANMKEADGSSQFTAACDISSNDFVVVFASEPITTTYGLDAICYWGYTELTIMSALISSLEKIAEEAERQIVLVVRPHPKETITHLAGVVGECRRVRVCFDSETIPRALINRADLVCGMSSMFLVESVIQGRPVLSIQIGLRREDPFICARRGNTHSIVDEKELYFRLRNAIVHGGAEVPAFEFICNPVDKVLAEIEKLLCRNWQ